MVCPYCGNGLPPGSQPKQCQACGRQLYTGSWRQRIPFSKRRARVFGALIALIGGWKLWETLMLCADAVRGHAAEYAAYDMTQTSSTSAVWAKVFLFSLVAELCMGLLLSSWGLYQLLNRRREVPASGSYLVAGILDVSLSVAVFCASFMKKGGKWDPLWSASYCLMIQSLCLVGIGVCYCIMRRRYAPIEQRRSLLCRVRGQLSDVILLGVDAQRVADVQTVIQDIFAMLGRDLPDPAKPHPQVTFPQILVEAVTPEDAELLHKRLTEVGAEVEVRPHIGMPD